MEWFTLLNAEYNYYLCRFNIYDQCIFLFAIGGYNIATKNVKPVVIYERWPSKYTNLIVERTRDTYFLCQFDRIRTSSEDYVCKLTDFDLWPNCNEAA